MTGRKLALGAIAVLAVIGMLPGVSGAASGAGSTDPASEEQAASPSTVEPRIVGGTKAANGEFPYQVMVLIYPGYLCGGSVIHPDWVLTAAHCVVDSSPGDVIVVAGTIDGEFLTGGDFLGVRGIAVQPAYNDFTAQNDFALLHLSRRAKESLVPLVRSGMTSIWGAGVVATVTGFGALSFGGPLPRYLQKVNVPIVSDASCATSYPPSGPFESFFDAASMVCAGGGTKDACQGDSGGPLVVRPGTWQRVQVGVVSWGEGCAEPGFPGVYSRVANFYSWIESVVGGPPNDDLAGATTPVCGVSANTEATQFATSQVDEPLHEPTSNPAASVWYAITPATDGTVHVNTLGSDFDTVLAVYTGASLAGLSVVARNNDIDSLSEHRSAVSFPVTGGTTYRIAVDGFDHLDGARAERGEVRANISFQPDTGPQFADVATSNAFFDDIAYIANQGVTSGYADCRFHPGAAVSRQAMAAFLYRFAGWDLTWHPDPGFTDVDGSSTFSKEIAWMVDEGIATGYSDGGFHPGAAVSRQAMAAFLYRFAGSPLGADPVCATKPFDDVPVGNAFCGEIEWMKDNGVAGGYDDGGYHPTASVSRQAMAAFMQNLPT